jgi:alkaline phosphatase D
MTDTRWRYSRRLMLQRGLVAGGGLLVAGTPLRGFAQATMVSDNMRITAPYGAQVGDVAGDRAILWSRADRPARMMVELSTTESFERSISLPGPLAVEDSDFTARLDMTGLPAGQRMFYRVRFLDLQDFATESEPVLGSFWTPPGMRGHIRFVWSGDTAGQGWGINPEWGGMRIYEAMRQKQPHFFIHSGDTIYADGPIEAEKKLADGTVWKNIVTEPKSKVAETLADFRGNYAYNLMDENLRRLNAEVAMYAQWDDHEVTNNWFWQKRMDTDPRYKEKSVAVMAARGAQAFMDYMPIRQHPLERGRLYTSFRWGPSLEVFRIDMRSYRGPNTDGRETELGQDARILGAEQIRWLKGALLASDATWKVIAADMPLGVIVWSDGQNKRGSEAVSQGDNGAAMGRELEIADLLTFIAQNDIRNVVWLTADVHYTAAHYYDPAKARYGNFKPFWEFVSGPLNAGTFGPNDLDATFGPQLMFVKAPPAGQANLPPSAGLQFFGQVDISGPDEVMTVSLCDLTGAVLFRQELTPEA